MLDLKKHMPAIEEICRRRSVKRLSIFGSALTDRFNAKSDIDLIVKYDRRKAKDLVAVFFGLQGDMEKVFDRSIDLMIEQPIRNPIFRDEVKKTKKIIYEQKN